MQLEEVRRRVARRQRDLERMGVRSLAVVGSTARGESKPDSDVDVLVEFDGPTTFDRYMDVKLLLEDDLGCRVDLVTRKALHPLLKDIVDREAVRVA